MPKLRPLEPPDHQAVLALNDADVRMLAPMDASRLELLQRLADRFDVLELDGAVAGFVVTFGPGSSYDSENYAWFTERHGDGFYYLDRIVVARDYRRRGLAGFVYDEIEHVARPHGRLALEVNLVPRNDVSLAFHAARGYVEVGRRGDPDHLVALMEKQL